MRKEGSAASPIGRVGIDLVAWAVRRSLARAGWLLAAGTAGALLWRLVWGPWPSIPRFASLLPAVALPLGFWAAVAGAQGSGQGLRHGLRESEAAAPRGDLSSLGYVGIPLLATAALLVVATATWFLSSMGMAPVGSTSASALLMPIAVIWAFALYGIWLGARGMDVRYIILGVLAVVAATAVVNAYFNRVGPSGSSGWRWLLPFVADGGVPPALADRPEGSRIALYLSTAFLPAAFLLRRVRGGGARIVAWLSLAGASIGLIFGVFSLVTFDDDGRLASAVAGLDVADDLVCDATSGVEVCVQRGYEPWLEHWGATVQPIADHVGDAVRLPRLVQGADLFSGLEVDTVPGPFTWGARGNRAWHEYRLAVTYSSALMGLPTPGTMEGLGPSERPGRCNAAGQARGAVLLWMAVEGHPERARFPSEGRTNPSAMISPTEFETARLLGALGESTVRRVIQDRWEELTSGRLTTNALREALGLPPAPEGRALGTPCSRDEPART